MKKVVIPATVLLAVILCFAGYKIIWGGKVQFTAFHYQESEYELFAKLVLDYHNGLKSDSESRTLLLFDTYFEDVTNDKTVELYGDEQDLLILKTSAEGNLQARLAARQVIPQNKAPLVRVGRLGNIEEKKCTDTKHIFTHILSASAGEQRSEKVLNITKVLATTEFL